MTNLRIGNDIIVKWALVMKGTSDPFILSGKNVSLYLRGVTGKKKIEDFSVAGNTITWTFYGKDQKHTGVYSLILVVNEGVEGMVTTDACNFVNLVSCSCKTGGSDDCGVYTETIELTSTIEYVAGEGGSYDDTEIRKELANKVDKEAGKGLSSNDYTDEDKVKLDGLENYDDSELSRELTELSAEVGRKQDTITDLENIRRGAAKGATALQNVPDEYATKQYVDEKVAQSGGGTNEEMQRILAGNSLNLIWEDLDGKLHYEIGVLATRKAQNDAYYRKNCRKIISCSVASNTTEWAFLFGGQNDKGVIEEVYPYIFNSAQLTSLNFAFSGAPNIKDWSFLKYLDTSKITSMSGVFFASEADTIDLSNWDVSNVTTLGNNESYTFFGSIKNVIGLENWDTSNAQKMVKLLSGVIKDYSGVKNWNVQNCSNFNAILHSISATNVDVSLWKIQDGANMEDFIRNGRKLVSFGMPNIPTGATTTNFGRYLESLQNITMRDDALIYASLHFNESPLTADSVKTLLSHLADTPDEGATITFNSGLYTGYSAEDKAEIDALRNTATTNGWTIVNMG